MSDAGRRFAYRERARSPGEPVRPVEGVKEGPPRSNKVKVRRLDGEYEGLEEWVPKVRLVAPWEEVEALLKDESRMFEALDATGDVYDTLPYKAVRTVFRKDLRDAGFRGSRRKNLGERGIRFLTQTDPETRASENVVASRPRSQSGRKTF
jgi:hypothetical protein